MSPILDIHFLLCHIITFYGCGKEEGKREKIDLMFPKNVSVIDAINKSGNQYHHFHVGIRYLNYRS